MRDLYRAIARVEHAVTRGLERPAAAPEKKRQPSPRVWHAPITGTQYPEQVFKKDKPMTQLTVTTRALKVVAVLDGAAVATLPTPDGQSRSHLTIHCEERIYNGEHRHEIVA
jgi:hypothetical protein